MIIRFGGKDDIVEIVKNLKFFNRALEQVDTVENYLKETGGGLVKWMQAEEDFGWEAGVVEKLKMVKGVVDKFGDDAINEYESLTSPNPKHPIYELFRNVMPDTKIFDDVFTPMKKSEFEIYLQVYQEFITPDQQ